MTVVYSSLERENDDKALKFPINNFSSFEESASLQ